MKTELKDVIHFYFGCEVEYGFEERKFKGELIGHDYRWGWQISNSNVFAPFRFCRIELIKPILRPLSDMTEEEFQDFAKYFFDKSELVFAVSDGYWYACEREMDEEFEGESIEYIQEACDADPENVLMCNIKSKGITYGWISHDEMYHGFSVKEEAIVLQWLLSKSFDLFGLIESGQAIEKKTEKL